MAARGPQHHKFMKSARKIVPQAKKSAPIAKVPARTALVNNVVTNNRLVK